MPFDITSLLRKMLEQEILSQEDYLRGQKFSINGQCQTLSIGPQHIEVLIDDAYADYEVKVEIAESGVKSKTKGHKENDAAHVVTALLQYDQEQLRADPKAVESGKKYTREGMIRRVMDERRTKSIKGDYRIKYGANPYGEHHVFNEKGHLYKVTFHDIPNETGYCTCLDYRTNKLGTCKHLMFAYADKKGEKSRLKKPRKPFPFVDIHLDPKQDYQIRWFHPSPDQLSEETRDLLHTYFGNSTHLPSDEKTKRGFLKFINEANELKQILIRPEVYEVIDQSFQQNLLQQVSQSHKIDWSIVNADLYPYQKKGVEFAAYKKGAIIADEMGLGKTLQAITTALVKKEAFGIEKTLIICPASVKTQWKQEIEKFSDAQALVIQGPPEVRTAQYAQEDIFFFILNYETVLRDWNTINKMGADFIILDEAQRIKNYETLTARAIKKLEKQHSLVITGTPIENRLLDLFSIMDFVDPYFLTPLWEFSYQHCYFDQDKKDKIVGYFNLQELKTRLKHILLRRTKREVIKELPQVSHLDIPVQMHPDQAMYHANYAFGVAKLMRKKFLTPYDFNRLMMLLNQMRMVCDSTFLIDQETYISPKLNELHHILIEKLDLQNQDRKIIIFSEWVRMNGLIGKLLREIGVSYVELNGKVPIPKRQALVNKFYNDPTCKVFLSTEAGGTGLNLQVADTIINFELPWNPAKKNQRIGRIDRIGQKAQNLLVINLITQNSIEQKIAAGLILKENLFENVLDHDSVGDSVDFSQKGRAQFLRQIELIMSDLETPPPIEEEFQEKHISSEEEEQISTPDIFGEQDMEPYAVSPEQETQPTTQVAKSVPSSTPSADSSSTPQESSPDQSSMMVEVMNQGMGFLAGMFKMMTGEDMNVEDQKIEIDPQSGEVVMRFKMPTTGKKQ